MKSSYTPDQIKSAISRYRCGESVANISNTSDVPVSTIYSWIRKECRFPEKQKYSLRYVRNLENKVARLEGMLEILRTADCSVKDDLSVKLPVIEKMADNYPIRTLCDALSVPTGTYYNFHLRNKRENTLYRKRDEELKPIIREIFDENRQIYGASKIRTVMLEKGYQVSEKKIAQLMKEMGLFSIRQDAKETHRMLQQRKEDHVKQQFTTSRPNEVWASDVTVLKINGNQYIYLCVVIDLFSRRIIGYKFAARNNTRLVKSTFLAAYEARSPQLPLIFHSDRGVNYGSRTFRTLLRDLDITQSFSRSGKPHDNAVVESFFASLKKEEYHRNEYRSEKDLKKKISEYISFYNEKRPHSANRDRTPVWKEENYARNIGKKTKPGSKVGSSDSFNVEKL